MKFITPSLSILVLWLCFACQVLACTNRTPDDPAAIPQLIMPKAKPSSWEQESYYHDLLRLILERTEAEFGPCTIDQTEHMLIGMLSEALISRDQGVVLLWGTASVEQEVLLYQIRIPLLQGLIG